VTQKAVGQSAMMSLQTQEVLARHDQDIRSLSDKVTHVESKLDNITDILEQLVNRPSFDWHKALGVVKDFGILISFVVIGVVYISNASYDATFKLLQQGQTINQQKSEADIKLALSEIEKVRKERRLWCEFNKPTNPNLICEPEK